MTIVRGWAAGLQEAEPVDPEHMHGVLVLEVLPSLLIAIAIDKNM